MPRTARAVEAGLIYHVMNRGNGRQRVFHKPADYDAFERILIEALERFPGVELLAYCLMPNHWHLVLCPRRASDLARFMGWLCVTHVRRHHQAHATRGGGHLYQGRFKSLPTQDDEHLLSLLRYVESNARRARLIERAERWRWCSLFGRFGQPAAGDNAAADRSRSRRKPLVPLSASPVPRPRNWLARVNQAMEERELAQLREAVQRGRPWGQSDWVSQTARRLGLAFTLRGPGRPRKSKG